ncbi:SMI1/KNR4 family protein [Thorsellia anophelis]|uniref:SMI1 / KNR4 family (SUKH-1) n=1 Tax=Thorsellia anophelis DSM 18579 TaxID=1123402 RepID=A0A1I0FL39_9GAMM|nr:SMI1/KNR4 family protein [Thorsellia anophelis]SET59085.1 SMI1 / KNR4 family (SUKH-1) [Thorsellia anophelis DSM 18579]
MVELVFKQQKLTNREWEIFESLFDKNLPEEFKKHYLENNGGFSSEEDVEADKWGFDISFNSIKYGTSTIENLIDDINEYSLNDELLGTWTRSAFVPFASGPFGIIFFLSLRDEDYGYIYFFSLGENNMGKVCQTFEEFLNRLYKR